MQCFFATTEGWARNTPFVVEEFRYVSERLAQDCIVPDRCCSVDPIGRNTSKVLSKLSEIEGFARPSAAVIVRVRPLESSGAVS
jgi:hypothetical protein